jgi:membrane associated rhomboid family serine protease
MSLKNIVAKEISSESKLVWNLLKSTVLFPFRLVMVLFGKKDAKELSAHLKDLWEFFFEAKATAVLILLNIIIFFLVALWLAPTYGGEKFITNYFVDHPKNLLTGKIVPILGSWFMHAGLAHLFGNMLFLLILGRIVEKNLGTAKMLFVYFSAAIGSTLLSDIVHIPVISTYPGGIGASGAIMGLASAAMLIDPLAFTWLAFGLPIPVMIVAWIFLVTDLSGILAPTTGDNVGHFAHLGGFFSVTVLYFILAKEQKEKIVRGFLINAGTLLLLGAVWFFVIRKA